MPTKDDEPQVKFIDDAPAFQTLMRLRPDDSAAFERIFESWRNQTAFLLAGMIGFAKAEIIIAFQSKAGEEMPDGLARMLAVSAAREHLAKMLTELAIPELKVETKSPPPFMGSTPRDGRKPS